VPFGFRPVDLLVLAVIALLFFGPKRLPEMGSAVGKTIKEFQKSMREVTHPNETSAQQTLPAAAQPVQTPQISTSTSAPESSAPERARETVSTTNSAAPADHAND
jgi:sec-independent protein translocase protein TatA